MKIIKALNYWEKYPKKRNTKEWNDMPVDWSNVAKIEDHIHSYFFRYNGYYNAKGNQIILKSTFGLKSKKAILEEIEYWFSKCEGAYTEIDYID